MTKVDLVTGFLGAGKTTYILDYARELIRRGERIGIIENDYGAINVDLMLLHRELSEQCRMEMVIGGDPDCHRRRLKTKLIAMGIDRYDRVIVEPSGVFDVDEFLDLLYEEPLDRMLSLGNVVTVVDADAIQRQLRTADSGADASGRGTGAADGADVADSGAEAGSSAEAGGGTETAGSLSPDARYILAEELTKAGCVVYSKAEQLTEEDVHHVTEYLNECLSEIGCRRVLSESDILRKTEGGLSEADWDRLVKAGSRDYSYVKRQVLEEGDFRSVFFFHVKLPEGDIAELLRRIFSDGDCGKLSRIKGFVPDEDGEWTEINATPEKVEVRRSPVGQPVVIAIGEGLDQERIGSYWEDYENEYRPEE